MRVVAFGSRKKGNASVVRGREADFRRWRIISLVLRSFWDAFESVGVERCRLVEGIWSLE